jgi:hypothetical protein
VWKIRQEGGQYPQLAALCKALPANAAVVASARGEQLLADAALEAIRTRLAPRASLITPNLDEVRLLIGIDVHDREAQYEAARRLHALGPRYVLVKGGHLREDVDRCVDLLYDGNTFSELPGPRFDTKQHSRCWRQPRSGHRVRAGEGDDHARRSRARQALCRGGRRALLLARRRAWPGIAAVDGQALVGRSHRAVDGSK